MVTDLARVFLEPANTTHRQYEALRAYFVEGASSAEAAERFGYTTGSFRVLCHKFRQDPKRAFFLPPATGPHSAPKKDLTRERVIALRKQNMSMYDIAAALAKEGAAISPTFVSVILKEEGFARLPRRGDDERPAAARPTVAAVADVGELDLAPRRFRTGFGGLFLFVPYLVNAGFDRVVNGAGLPGSKMIPAAHAMRSLLALKLFGNARHSHIMSHVLDEGLGLFAGLNVIPKRSFLTEYSCRIDPASYPALMTRWFDAAGRLGLERGVSFDLDFHTIPFHGEDALVEKHYVSRRSRRQKGVLAFLAQDADRRVFCYANAGIRKDGQNDEIIRFVDFWRARTGRLPEELVFDSRLTTYANLSDLDARGINFITLRRRTRAMLREVHQVAPGAWRRIELANVTRAYRTPRVLDRHTTLGGYAGPIRELVVDELGHEPPTVILTNHLKLSAAKLVERYARRMVIENGIQDGVDFFHMDALSSAVAMKVNCDLQLTLMASSLYRLLGTALGHGYEHAKSRHIFRDFVDASATVDVRADEIEVRLQKRAHDPMLVAAGVDAGVTRVPWLGNRPLRLALG